MPPDGVNGSPIEDWAGPIAVAAGYEYREEHYSQRGDPYAAGISSSTPATINEPCTDPAIDCGLSSLGSLGSYSAGNYHNARGTYHVNEVFVELGIPLLNDSWANLRQVYSNFTARDAGVAPCCVYSIRWGSISRVWPSTGSGSFR